MKNFLKTNHLFSLNRSDLLEMSRHAGFDARLCFGDITLGFRFFPNGLPESTLMQDEDPFIWYPIELNFFDYLLV